MDVMNILKAHKSMKESEELFMRFDDGNYTYVIKPEDQLNKEEYNTISINRRVYIDTDKISYLHVRGRVEL